jgi:hypothetical protein
VVVRYGVQQLVDVVSTGGLLDACNCCTLQVGFVEVARGAFCATIGQNWCSPVEQVTNMMSLAGCMCFWLYQYEHRVVACGHVGPVII